MVIDLQTSAQSPKRYLILTGLISWNLVLLFVLGAALVSQAQRSRITSVDLRDSHSLYRGTSPVTSTPAFTYYLPLVVNNYAALSWVPLGLHDLPIRQVVSSTNGALYAVIDSALILTPTNSIYRSIDASGSWQGASNGLLGNVRSLFVHPLSPTMLLAGTLMGITGVHSSADSGDTWESRGLDAAVRVVAASPTSPTLWLAAYDNPVYPWLATIMRTDNAGLTWESVYSSGVIFTDLQFDPLNPARAHACGVAGYLRSEDAGLTWEHVTFADCEALAIVPYSTTIMYVAEGTQVMRTENDGVTWTPVLTAEPYVSHLALYPTNPPQVYAATYKTLFRSIDGGATWQEVGPDGHITFSYINDIAVGNPDVVYVGTDQGVWKVTFK